MDESDARLREPELATDRPLVLVANVDCALFELLQQWLSAIGCNVLQESSHRGTLELRPSLLIVDIPFPREDGLRMLQALADRHASVPVVALSATFLPGTKPAGTVAKMLGVAAAVPSPVSRDALINVVQDLLAGRHDAEA